MRLRQGFSRGVTTSNPLGASATEITSAAFASLVEVAGGDYLVLVLDPEGAFGAPEIVHVTAHAPASETVTVVRGNNITDPPGDTGTANRAHPAGTTWRHGPTPADAGGGGGAAEFPNIAVITATDAEWEIPAETLYVEIVSGGGAGGGTASANSWAAGAGGGAGGYAAKRITGLTPGATVAVTVGAGGTGGTGAGGNGGTSSFGTHASVTGGTGGATGTDPGASGGLGGEATGGDLNVRGNPGGQGLVIASTGVGGTGGGSAFGGAGVGRVGSQAGQAALGYGGGGGGSCNTNSAANRNGGDGFQGVVIVRW